MRDILLFLDWNIVVRLGLHSIDCTGMDERADGTGGIGFAADEPECWKF